MRTKFYFLLAVVAFIFAACEDNKTLNGDVIKLYQGTNEEAQTGAGVVIEDGSTIVVDRVENGEVIFDGYVENLTDDYINLNVKVEKKSEGLQQMFCPVGESCKPESPEYVVKEDLMSEDFAVFAAHCVPDDKATAGEFNVAYTFYAEEYPDNTITVNVTYKYAPAE